MNDKDRNVRGRGPGCGQSMQSDILTYSRLASAKIFDSSDISRWDLNFFVCFGLVWFGVVWCACECVCVCVRVCERERGYHA